MKGEFFGKSEKWLDGWNQNVRATIKKTTRANYPDGGEAFYLEGALLEKCADSG